ncbi:glutathione S-transferase [Mollisia scopiformis]|uniref:Glutathione S-transferase n=1 Tax=Mollisia scopiformis TaxID=149040 RepID=A0A194XCA2_MOLSC|nr:glutathione S-transferase [Mollisia scopiformis]KUJ17795.1 glutathione S-transferase [Mollisia scopiformis]
MLTLISATPSPYARKNRILMLEKGIPFQLQTEIPWHSTTETPKYNPLEKLPILIFDDGRPPIYESWYIQEYIVQKYRGTGPDLMPSSIDDQLLVRQIQVLADGACDAMGLVFFENGRGEMKSHEWHDRQMRKVTGVLKASDELVKKSDGKFLVGGEYSVADIALGAMLGFMNMVETNFGIIHWLEEYPELRKYWEMLEAKESFKATQPVMFELTEKVA